MPSNGSFIALISLSHLTDRHAVPVGHDEPQGRTVLRRERHPVHLVGEENLPAQGILQRQASLVVVLTS